MKVAKLKMDCLYLLDFVHGVSDASRFISLHITRRDITSKRIEESVPKDDFDAINNAYLAVVRVVQSDLPDWTPPLDDVAPEKKKNKKKKRSRPETKSPLPKEKKLGPSDVLNVIYLEYVKDYKLVFLRKEEEGGEVMSIVDFCMTHGSLWSIFTQLRLQPADLDRADLKVFIEWVARDAYARICSILKIS